jgi:hypothetical protein
VLGQVSQAEAENFAVLSSTRDDAEGLAKKIALLESELVEGRWAHEMSEREHRKCFDKLNLLQTRGSKLCLSIVGPPRA